MLRVSDLAWIHLIVADFEFLHKHDTKRRSMRVASPLCSSASNSVLLTDENAFMHAATVELLVQKAHLEPDTALAIAEAIDMSIHNAQLVTVPILDSRFASFEAKADSRFASVDARFAALEDRFDAKLEKTKAEIVRWVFLVMLGNVALSAGATALLNAVQHGR